MDHNECQLCRARHKHTPGAIVHHSFHLDQYPQYGLAVWVDDPANGGRRRNLITVCRECHETVCHPNRRRIVDRPPPLTKERW